MVAVRLMNDMLNDMVNIYRKKWSVDMIRFKIQQSQYKWYGNNVYIIILIASSLHV